MSVVLSFVKSLEAVNDSGPGPIPDGVWVCPKGQGPEDWPARERGPQVGQQRADTFLRQRDEGRLAGLSIGMVTEDGVDVLLPIDGDLEARRSVCTT
jgi:hypothetical protein